MISGLLLIIYSPITRRSDVYWPPTVVREFASFMRTRRCQSVGRGHDGVSPWVADTTVSVRGSQTHRVRPCRQFVPGAIRATFKAKRFRTSPMSTRWMSMQAAPPPYTGLGSYFGVASPPLLDKRERAVLESLSQC